MPERYRHEAYPNTTQQSKKVVVFPDGSSHEWNYTHSKTRDKYRLMSDYVTPLYSKIISQGGIVNNNMYLEKHSLEYRPGGASWTVTAGGKVYTYTFTGTVEVMFGSGIMPQEPSTTEISMSMLRFRALSQVDSTPYQMMEDVFEIRQTLGYLRNPLKTILSLASSFKKDVRKTMRRRKISRKRATASVWLEYRFALMPLLRSAYDIVGSLRKEFEFPPRRTSRCYRDKRDSIVSFHTQYGNVWAKEATVWQEAGAGILYSVTNPAGEFRSTYGLRAKDIPVTLWAVFPLSFMIDRLIDISGSIRGLTALLDPSVAIHAGWTVRKKEVDLSSTLTYTPLDSFQSTSGGKHEITFTYQREEWNPSALDAIPGITPINVVNSVTKVMDLIALIVQRFK
jgi:hypothetical protein